MNHVVLILYFLNNFSRRGTPTSPAYSPCIASVQGLGPKYQTRYGVHMPKWWQTRAYSGNVKRRIFASVRAQPTLRRSVRCCTGVSMQNEHVPACHGIDVDAETNENLARHCTRVVARCVWMVLASSTGARAVSARVEAAPSTAESVIMLDRPP